MQGMLGEQPERDDLHVTSLVRQKSENHVLSNSEVADPPVVKRKSTLRYMRRPSEDKNPGSATNQRLKALKAAVDEIQEMAAHESERHRSGTVTEQRLEALLDLCGEGRLLHDEPAHAEQRVQQQRHLVLALEASARRRQLDERVQHLDERLEHAYQVAWDVARQQGLTESEHGG